jgi:hypothetical protein
MTITSINILVGYRFECSAGLLRALQKWIITTYPSEVSKKEKLEFKLECMKSSIKVLEKKIQEIEENGSESESDDSDSDSDSDDSDSDSVCSDDSVSTFLDVSWVDNIEKFVNHLNKTDPNHKISFNAKISTCDGNRVVDIGYYVAAFDVKGSDNRCSLVVLSKAIEKISQGTLSDKLKETFIWSYCLNKEEAELLGRPDDCLCCS